MFYPCVAVVKNERSFYNRYMPKVSEEYRTARKHEISVAAVKLFATKGFQGTSMADIIEASGLSAGAIYGHYKSKDELISFAIRDLFTLRTGQIQEGLATHPMLPPGEIIRLFVKGIEAEVDDLGILVQVWAQASLELGMRGIADEIVERFLELFSTYLRGWYGAILDLTETETEAAASRFAALYVGILQGYVVQSAIHPGFDGEAYLRAASAIRPEVDARV
jgi:AcrR family transcriptional regulator